MRDQRATVLGDQRENVAGRDNIIVICRRIDGDGNRAGTVMCGNAGGDAFLGLNGYREGGLHAFAVVAGHHVEAQRVGTLLRHGEADQATAMTGHEIDLLRGREGCGDDQVTLILAILGIDQDIHAAIAGVLDDLVNRGNGVVETFRHE